MRITHPPFSLLHKEATHVRSSGQITPHEAIPFIVWFKFEPSKTVSDNTADPSSLEPFTLSVVHFNVKELKILLPKCTR